MRIFCPGMDRWDWMIQRPQQLLRAAARRGHEVLWWGQGTSPQLDGLEVEPGIRTFGQIQEARDAAGRGALLYYTNPNVVQALDRLRRGPVLFDLLDDFPQNRPAAQEAVKTADHVICTSSVLDQALTDGRVSHVRVANGCDFSHWSAPRPIPPDLEGLPAPRAVFIGALGRWVDFSRLVACAEVVPAASVVVVGPDLQGWLLGDRPANLHALGYRDYADLPGYAQHADVLLLPFRGELAEARAANPVKMWEYFATGRPVVATPVPDTAEQTPHLTLAAGSAFEAAVARVLTGDTDLAAAGARRAWAAENTWDHRWAQVEAWLASYRPAPVRESVEAADRQVESLVDSALTRLRRA